jgi:hypothetical protein
VLSQLKGLLASVQPKSEVKEKVETKVDAELASKQAALKQQNAEFTGISPEVEILTKVVE